MRRPDAGSGLVGCVKYGVTNGRYVREGPSGGVRLLGPSLACRNEGWLSIGKASLGLLHLLLQV